MSSRLTLNRRTMLASTAACAVTFVGTSALSLGVNGDRPTNRVADKSAASCHHDHTFQVSALMVSMGSPALSADQKATLVTNAHCPHCKTALTTDIMAQIACQSACATTA